MAIIVHSIKKWNISNGCLYKILVNDNNYVAYNIQQLALHACKYKESAGYTVVSVLIE